MRQDVHATRPARPLTEVERALLVLLAGGERLRSDQLACPHPRWLVADALVHLAHAGLVDREPLPTPGRRGGQRYVYSITGAGRGIGAG